MIQSETLQSAIKGVKDVAKYDIDNNIERITTTLYLEEGCEEPNQIKINEYKTLILQLKNQKEIIRNTIRQLEQNFQNELRVWNNTK